MSHLLEQSILGEALQNASLAAYVSRDGDVVALNDAVCTLTGYSRDEIVGGLVPSIAADEDARRQQQEVEAGVRSAGTARILRKDGSALTVSYVLSRTHVGRDELTFGLLWPAG